MWKAGNLGKFLRRFTNGFSRLPAACPVRLAGKGGPAKNVKYFNEAWSILSVDINHSMGHGFESGPFFDRSRNIKKAALLLLDLLDPDPDPGGKANQRKGQRGNSS
jgi:hypothetical protein